MMVIILDDDHYLDIEGDFFVDGYYLGLWSLSWQDSMEKDKEVAKCNPWLHLQILLILLIIILTFADR